MNRKAGEQKKNTRKKYHHEEENCDLTFFNELKQQRQHKNP